MINKKYTVIIIISLSLIVGLTLTNLQNKPAKIVQQIEKANYCEVDSDCVDAGSKCPFGCYAYVNKKEVDRISDLISSYESNCAYSCLACPEAKCVNNKCEEVCR